MVNQEDLARVLDRHDRDRPLVLTCLNSKYLPLFWRWWEGFRRFEPVDLLVMCLDDETRTALSGIGVSLCDFRVEHPTDFIGELWIRRLELVSELLRGGVTLIQSDIDAFWIRDPRPYLAESPADIAIQVEYGVPMDVRDQWGFVLCCGFMRLRPTPALLGMLPDWNAWCVKDRHDQNGLNHLLLEAGIAWDTDDTEGNYGRAAKYGVEVDVIDRRLSSRQPYQQALIYHPFLHPKPVWRKARVAAAGLRQIGGYPLSRSDYYGSMLPLEHLTSRYKIRKTLKKLILGNPKPKPKSKPSPRSA